MSKRPSSVDLQPATLAAPGQPQPGGHGTAGPDAAILDHEREVLEAIRGTRFGTVEITVHQSRIVQITRSEKLRFEPR
ncbi:YezD family protein [Lysobacter fragariae]